MEVLVRANFIWNEGGRKVDKEEERTGYEKVEGEGLEDMVAKVKHMLSGIQNSSAPSLDGISYSFIKGINNIILQNTILEEVARNLTKGKNCREWQNSKLVMIPKPEKDYEKTKRWRPINLIHCIGKIGAKVVADELQGYRLLHKNQFT